MARTPRSFSRRGRAEAKARKNIGQDESRKDVTEKAMQRIQREAISEVSLIGVRAALWECLDCPACAPPVFTEEGCLVITPGAKGSFP